MKEYDLKELSAEIAAEFKRLVELTMTVYGPPTDLNWLLRSDN